MMNKWLQYIQSWLKPKPVAQTEDYFKQANDWSDDYYLTIYGSRNRYRVAFFFMSMVCLSLACAITALVPAQHFEPLLVHHYDSGTVSISPLRASPLPFSQAEVESDIIRYVTNRESYSKFAFEHQANLVNLLSSEKQSEVYNRQQQLNQPTAYINQFGDQYEKSVQVESVIFLSSAMDKNKHNLAEVNFTTQVINVHTGQKKSQHFVATLSWVYLGIPEDLTTRWQNWSGFQVTDYRVSQRSL